MSHELSQDASWDVKLEGLTGTGRQPISMVARPLCRPADTVSRKELKNAVAMVSKLDPGFYRVLMP